MELKRVLLGLLIPLLAMPLSSSASAEISKSTVLESIRDEGVIKVGVKTDFQPFGFLSKEGDLQGFEVDLARLIGDAIGVRVELVGVSTANRFQRLEQGLVQLVIATAADTRERRRIATAIEPGYFGAGVNVLLRPEVNIQDWAGLRGKNICALQAAYFNKGITSRFVIDLKTYKSIQNAQAALQQGECVGFLYSEIAVQGYLKKPEFSGYKADLDPALVVPWAAFVARSEKGNEFEVLLGDTIARLHRDGILIALQEKWGMAKSLYLAESRTRWSAVDGSGAPLCQRTESGEWVVECRDKAFITSADVEGVNAIFKRVEEATGMNFSFAYDKYDRDRYIKGLSTSLQLIVFLDNSGASGRLPAGEMPSGAQPGRGVLVARYRFCYGNCSSSAGDVSGFLWPRSRIDRGSRRAFTCLGSGDCQSRPLSWCHHSEHDTGQFQDRVRGCSRPQSSAFRYARNPLDRICRNQRRDYEPCQGVHGCVGYSRAGIAVRNDRDFLGSGQHERDDDFAVCDVHRDYDDLARSCQKKSEPHC